MRRWHRYLALLPVLGMVAGGFSLWRIESTVPSASTGAVTPERATTPVLAVRRLPSVVARPVAARRLRVDLDALVAFLPANSCLAVEGPDGLAYGHRADTPVTPASTTKLLTATGALLALDPAARLRTAVVAAQPAGAVVPSDLTLVGGGDPLLATADYTARFTRQPQLFTDLEVLAARVQEAGVRRVEGSVVGDEQRYDQVRYVAGWPARYIAQDVIGPLSALALNDGFERYPDGPGTGGPLDPAADPAENAAAVLTRLLEARGVDVVGAPRSGVSPPDAVEVAAVDSPSVGELVAQMLQESDNNTAELLLKEIGRSAGDPSTAGGAAALVASIGDDEIDLSGAAVIDGSGLSLDDRVTCSLLTDLLLRPGTGAELVDRLAVAGESGTLATRFAGTSLAGALRAKTGSLTSVAALAGVVVDDDPSLTFALIMNVPPPAAIPAGAADLQQSIVEVLAAWPRRPDLDLLGPLKSDG